MSGESEMETSEVEYLKERVSCAAVLEKVCRLAPDDPLYRLVLEKEQELREKGWIA